MGRAKRSSSVSCESGKLRLLAVAAAPEEDAEMSPCSAALRDIGAPLALELEAVADGRTGKDETATSPPVGDR
jgi:hypothetical protein